MTSIFIFHRDLRLYDNIGFINTLKYSISNSYKILPIFIFTPQQIDKKKNKYFSNNSIQFMIECLYDLNNELNSKLRYFYGENTNVLDKIYKDINSKNTDKNDNKIKSIHYNIDYTPFAIKRDKEIKEWCKKKEIECFEYSDYLLSDMGDFLKNDGTPYEKYTPFKNNAKNIVKKNGGIKKCQNYKKDDLNIYNYFNSNDIVIKKINKMYNVNPNILVKGGRQNALLKLKNINDFAKYGSERNLLQKQTTELSSYIKFGSISIREVYHKIVELFGVNHVLIDQLYWREFYYYIAYYFNRVLKGESLKLKYNNIIWRNNKKMFKAWTNGMTGFPVVDAGMRQLNLTGFMHNRARLITSGVLIKILNIDWRWGERYFANKLTDYDPAVNNGNWQWGSGSGVDSQPYFRIFNPWNQTLNYDPNCIYIKTWIPELKDVPIKDILNWDKCCNNEEYKNIKYPCPIVDYTKERIQIMKTYKKALK